MSKQKSEFVHQLAKFFTENVGAKSIILEIESRRQDSNPMPKLATEWGQLRTAAGIRGYPTLDEAKDTLNELLS